ncbi:MAG TPA: zf-HC2 domain-containing protein [Candidatus Evtepia faecigallinarum]|nr:zf-HC2 domain-containing protein [Candidatus Evtepia faecigallinarum]
MKLPCSVIEDLLPAYCDNACRPASREAVAEHLRCCPRCRRLHDCLCRPLGRQEEQAAISGSLEEKWRRQKTIDGFQWGMMALLVGAAVFFLLGVVQFTHTFPMGREAAIVRQVQVREDGAIAIDLWLDGRACELAYETPPGNKALYLVPKRQLFPWGPDSQEDWEAASCLFYQLDGEEEYGPEGAILLADTIDAIYVGPVGDAVQVWERTSVKNGRAVFPKE